MLKLEGIVGAETEGRIAQRLHALAHDGRVEYLLLSEEETRRHRLRTETDRGTECAVVLGRTERLYDGAVLLLDSVRAVVVRMRQTPWLKLVPRDAAAALELGYFAGNMHWAVRFESGALKVAISGPEESYLERLTPFLNDGRVTCLAAD